MNSFNSEFSLARHRTSVPFPNMLSWLQIARPNGIHPLPVPIPLQTMGCSFVRPTANETKDPWIVVTRIALEVQIFPDIEGGVTEFNEILPQGTPNGDRHQWRVKARSRHYQAINSKFRHPRLLIHVREGSPEPRLLGHHGTLGALTSVPMTLRARHRYLY